MMLKSHFLFLFYWGYFLFLILSTPRRKLKKKKRKEITRGEINKTHKKNERAQQISEQMFILMVRLLWRARAVTVDRWERERTPPHWSPSQAAAPDSQSSTTLPSRSSAHPLRPRQGGDLLRTALRSLLAGRSQTPPRHVECPDHLSDGAAQRRLPWPSWSSPARGGLTILQSLRDCLPTGSRRGDSARATAFAESGR